MHIAHLSAWRVPVQVYGGSQRVVIWQAKAQMALGHRVTLLARPGSSCPGAEVIAVPDGAPYSRYLPDGVQVAHVHGARAPDLPVPHLITVQGNSPSELIPTANKVFVSADHARRAGSRAFVYNGVDPEEYIYREHKEDYLLFLSKVSRQKKKGVDVALHLARRLGFRLVVAGGRRHNLRTRSALWDSICANVHFCGGVGGRRKAELIAGARALLFPVRWEEPFGIVVAEALISGTPVITTPVGAMPELISSEVGFLCRDPEEMAEAIRHVGAIAPAACRRRALEHFTSAVSARKYLHYYERLRAGQPLENTAMVEATSAAQR